MVCNLPRLARLVPFMGRAEQGAFGCRSHGAGACCRGRGCARAAAVEDAVLRGLPAAAEAAGRRLTVELHGQSGRVPEWHADYYNEGTLVVWCASLAYERAGR